MQRSTLTYRFLLALAGALWLAACGSGGGTTTGTNTDTDTDTGSTSRTYVVVDTGQTTSYDNDSQPITVSRAVAFYGQDAVYQGPQPSYRDNGDGTVSDLNTGLMWQQDPGGQVTLEQAQAGASTLNLAGYNDWRLPTVKELYSLIDFSGSTNNLIPYLDTTYFTFEYGDVYGERDIDAQFFTSTMYVGQVFGMADAVFGVNFADGRIKGYGLNDGFDAFVRYVRGNTAYGINNFVDNGDGTVTDEATGLMWQQGDSGAAMSWQEALAYAEDLVHAGHSDWRLPNAKELQSIVDYTRAPQAIYGTQGPAIDPIFSNTIEEAYYWTGTTHLDGPEGQAVYVCFGRALGFFNGQWQDVHGAGSQRSDFKTGDPANYPEGFGPQGDDIRIDNWVRCVRDAD